MFARRTSVPSTPLAPKDGVKPRRVSRAPGSRVAGLLLAGAAMLGLVLSPFCDALAGHSPGQDGTDASTAQHAAPGVGASAEESRHDKHDGPCCSEIAEQAMATGSDAGLRIGDGDRLAIVPAPQAWTPVRTSVRRWHKQRPGSPPVAALHARSAPLLN